MTSNPWDFHDELIDEFANNPKMDKYIHLPVQSGSNAVLYRMNRGYTRENYLELITKIRNKIPDVVIGTDIIVGFPGETDQDFEDTYNFMKDTPISKFHVFRFSKRNHTAAYYLSKRLTEPDSQSKIKRAKALADLGKKKYEMFLQKHVGKEFSTLLLQRRDGDIHHSLLSNQVPVKVKTDTNYAGEIKNTKIISYKNGELFGRIV